MACTLSNIMQPLVFQKRITDELKEKGDNPGTPADFVGYLKKHFGGKLTTIECDEIELDTGMWYLQNLTQAHCIYRT